MTDVLTEADAKRLTTRIQLRLDTIADSSEAVLTLVEEAKAGNVHEVLGYPSWTKYVAENFGGALARLGRAERMPFVALLADQGMSTRAIGEVVGSSKSTVATDLSSLQRLRALTSDSVATDTVGTDGKVYKRPAPKAPRRRPLPDAYRDAVWDLDRVIRRLERLHADDRFVSNRETVQQPALLGEIAFVFEEIMRDLAGHNSCVTCGKRRPPIRGQERESLQCEECRD